MLARPQRDCLSLNPIDRYGFAIRFIVDRKQSVVDIQDRIPRRNEGSDIVSVQIEVS